MRLQKIIELRNTRFLAIVGISAVVLAICLAPTEEDPRNHVGGIHPASDCDPQRLRSHVL